MDECRDHSPKEKYTTWSSYALAWMTRFVLRSALRTTVNWNPLHQPQDGYSIIIGVPWFMWDLLDVPLASLNRSHRSNCRTIYLCVDAAETIVGERFGHNAIDHVRCHYPNLHLELLWYTPWQRWVTSRINWNWVDCWLTWTKGLAACRTRYALLHDFDAVVTDPDFIENHYRKLLASHALMCGISHDNRLQCHGPDFLATVELILDVQRLRARYHPVEMFNRVRRYRGARIECDILRDIQMREPEDARLMHVLDAGVVVHPSQLVSEWRQLQQQAQPFVPEGFNSLLVIPYFRYVTGYPESMRSLTDALRSGVVEVPIDGRLLNVSRLHQPGCDRLAKQIARLDVYFAGSVSGPVAEYCDAIRQIPRRVTGRT